MNYDQWKTTDPNDRYLGPDPDDPGDLRCRDRGRVSRGQVQPSLSSSTHFKCRVREDKGRPMSRWAMHNPNDPNMEQAIDRADHAKKAARENLPKARVYSTGDGWFYHIFGDDDEIGPFATTIEAGRACRSALIARAEATATDG